MKRIPNFIPVIFLLFLFRSTFQQSFNVFSDKQGEISSIVLSDGNIVVFVNDFKNEKYQEYAQKLSTEGALSGSNIAFYEGISSSLPMKTFSNPAGGFYVIFLNDDQDVNGFFSYIGLFQNDLTKTKSFNNKRQFLLDRNVCLFIGNNELISNSGISSPGVLTDVKIDFDYFTLSSLFLGTYKSVYFKTFLYYTDINAITLQNGKGLIVLSALDFGLSSFYLVMKVFDLSNKNPDAFNTDNLLIDSSSPATGVNHLYTQFAIESSTGNVIIAYQSTGSASSSYSAVKYAVLDSTASSTLIKTPSFLTDSDSSNVKYPKVICLNNQGCIISWIDSVEKICFQKINLDGTLSGTKILGPKVEQPTSHKSGSLIQIPNSNDFIYFHSVTSSGKVIGYKFNSDCQMIYTTETCQYVLSADKLTCTSTENCLVYKSDRSACSECQIRYELDGSNLCVVQAIVYCKTYTDNTKTACATCDANHFRSETGKICAEPITGCSIYSDSKDICQECDAGKISVKGGFACEDPKYFKQTDRSKCVECLHPSDRPDMNVFIHAHYRH